MSPDRGATRVREGGYDVRCRPEAEEGVRTWLLPDPAARAEAGEVLRRSRYRTTACVAWPGHGPVLLKAHAERGGLDALLSAFRPSRARAEWEAARYLEGAGLPTARAWAFGERRAGPRLAGAFFAAGFLGGARALEAEARVPRTLLRQAARLVRAVHDAGFDHRDLHAGNVLRVGDRLGLVDLHRGRLGAPVPERRRVAALARFAHSLSARLGPGGRLALLVDYDPEAPRPVLHRRLRRLERTLARLEDVRRRSRGKRWRKESTVYTQEIGPGRGTRRRDLPPERLERALAEHDAALAAGDTRVAKRNRRGCVTCHGDLVVKESTARHPVTRLRVALVPGRASAGLRHAHGLTVRGVATATPLALVRRGGRTFTLYADLSRFPRLDHLAGAVFRGADRAAARALLEASADWAAGLHRRGIYHGDLKGVNVRVEVLATGPRFHLIDTDRCRFARRPVGARRRVKNLAQLAASIPRAVTRTDRLRWFRRYAAGTPLLAREGAVARAVAARLARKVVVVDDPIE